MDFSLATDGLVAEREQGITIDVAHIYFSTPKKSYIIADTPGHVEYTRNMVTGASTSQAAIILIDARKGVIAQTHRHFFINNLLRIKEVVVAINKMDLVDFSEARYQSIKSEFEELMGKRDYAEQRITFIPVSALKGITWCTLAPTCHGIKEPRSLTIWRPWTSKRYPIREHRDFQYNMSFARKRSSSMTLGVLQVRCMVGSCVWATKWWYCPPKQGPR